MLWLIILNYILGMIGFFVLRITEDDNNGNITLGDIMSWSIVSIVIGSIVFAIVILGILIVNLDVVVMKIGFLKRQNNDEKDK